MNTQHNKDYWIRLEAERAIELEKAFGKNSGILQFEPGDISKWNDAFLHGMYNNTQLSIARLLRQSVTLHREICRRKP